MKKINGLMNQMANVYYNFSITSTTQSNFIQWNTVKPKVDPKEQRRLDRIRAQAAKRKARGDAWLAQKILEIKADSLKNAWRPQVSNSKPPPLGLAYWSLGRASEDEWYPEGQPTWRTWRKLYDNGWCGITLCDYSEFEYNAMLAFAKKLGKACRQYLPEHSHCEAAGISYGDYSTGFWFKNVEDHNAFVEMLEAFPRRNINLVLGDAAEPDAIHNLLKGENYRLVLNRREEMGVLSMVDGNNAILARMFCG